MAEWWYITIHRCPDCGASYERYDHTAPWYDSGLSTAPIVDEYCTECWDERVRVDQLENVDD